MVFTSVERNLECNGPLERSGWRIWLVLCLPTFYYVQMWLRDDFTKNMNIDDHILMENFDDKVNSWNVANLTTVARSNNSDQSLTGLKVWLMDSIGAKPGDTKIVPHLNISHDDVKPTNLYPKLKVGGYFAPEECQARHYVAVIVPYRGRHDNLKIFLYNIHPFLMAQKLQYQIFIIEQYGNASFNMGRLYNAGYREIQEYGKWKCVVFHDVDLLPTDRRILYTCPTYPRHMCAGTLHDPTYRPLFGGVVAMTPEHYEKANGYSNLFWGRGGEDDDMFWRLRFTGTTVVRYDKRIAKYWSLPHNSEPKNERRFEILKTIRDRWKHEGLSSVKYRLMGTTFRHLFTHIVVDINPFGDTY
ncbi:beta-1,4-N-acetylgalactosaminyltransferase bre-4-like [Hyposmocoma kahamanoa]|uniref:beta-1,4-N-acetylgalactosaminyltransferase bre-4-like n=1 Tax=Hyposmocoma kahamanoa TaxID=1477025 RepID=UPI000E6D6CCC|nr:beta-1,4-N-acetylgalactosaminyltransferase bre-4-like [Hyposmocoma kahamanoa]